MQFVISPSSALKGRIKVAGDKSVSHRSIIFGAISNGVSTVKDILEGEDVMATIAAFRQMGVAIERNSNEVGDNNYSITGVGLNGLNQPQLPLDMGNSGTAFRLLAGLLCAQPWHCELIGDESLSQRPMGRIIDPLKLMGANLQSSEGKPPLKISPASQIRGINYSTPMASAQVKSAILLAGLYAQGTTTVIESAPTRDHTERMLQGFGYSVNQSGRSITIQGGGELQAQDMVVPADLSSATFFILGALITQNSDIMLPGVGINPSRNGVISVLQRMGADITLHNQSVVGGEPVADIQVRSSNLKGIDICGDDIALSIDEIPSIAVAAACAQGLTRISDAEELRVKESDRISSVVNGLTALGAEVTEKPDGMDIQGGPLREGVVESYGDHRIAMAFSMAGAVANKRVTIRDCENVATSFPDFQQLAKQSGLNIEVII